MRYIAAVCVSVIGIGLLSADNAYSMGLRSFVALPVEKEGTVVRFSVEHAQDADTDTLISSAAYGMSAKQTLLVGIPYRLSPAGKDRQGDVSVLYRQIVKQQDRYAGTKRFALLGGAIIPTKKERDVALQTGFVYTQFHQRHEVDADVLYQLGTSNRKDSGRYDLSWQYRLLPIERPDWGTVTEINSVIELNGRWQEGNNITHQATIGLQWVQAKWVFEGGVVKDLNNDNELRYLISTRFHF
ncbi:MAG TPA: hypothetical protein ENJ33_01850 [Thiothrix sp.]|nr:hypothetical protein [Thiothrix sp.]